MYVCMYDREKVYLSSRSGQNMPCLCSDSARLFQARIPAACAANLRHHAPECRESPRNRDSRSANCTIEMQIERIDAPCAWILPRGPLIHSPCAVIQRAPKAKQTANTRATTTASASATAKPRLSTRAKTFGIFCILGAAQDHCTGWVNQRPSGQHPCTGCMDYNRRILMVQVAFLESRFRGDSLHFRAWGLRLAAQAAVIRTCKK